MTGPDFTYGVAAAGGGDRRAPFDAVLIAAPDRRADMISAIALAGGRIVETLGWDELDTLVDRQAGRRVLAIEADGVADTVLEAGLPHIAATLDLVVPQIVVTLHRAQIDLIAAALLGSGVQLLCDDGMARRVAALAIAGMAAPGGLRDRVAEPDDDGVRRLKDEIGRIADLLVRLADHDRPGAADEDDGVADRRLSFGFEPPAAPVDPQLVRQAIRARRMRDDFLGPNLFEDPAWDMLLDLYAARLEGRRVSVSSLCIAAAVAPTTALRWITRMTEAGLFERQPDPSDRRRAFMALSPRAAAGMDAYMAALRRAGLPIA
jgi:DNA-binding MarR family transcriptional regulator